MRIKYITILEENIKIKVRKIPKAPVWQDFGYFLFTKAEGNVLILTPNGKHIILSKKMIKESKDNISDNKKGVKI